MAEGQKTRVAVNGYGVIGKPVAAAVMQQDDMALAGVSDVVTDWRARMVTRNGIALYGATGEHANAMREAGLDVTGTLGDLIAKTDAVVDCTPKRIAAKNVDEYRRRGLKFILKAGKSLTQPVTPSSRRRTMRLPSGETRLLSRADDTPGEQRRSARCFRGSTRITMIRIADAIRALTGTVQDAATSIARTNAALGVEAALV